MAWVQIAIAPDPIAVGETGVLTVTITNQAPDPATNLSVTAPTPAGALALPGPSTLSPTRGWSWSQARLDGKSSVVLTGTLRLVDMPPGEALLASAEATAQGLPLPIHGSGGALVVDRAQGPVTTPFTPGTPAVLKSADGHLSVTIPADAAARRLSIRHTPRPNLGANQPPAVAGHKRGFGIFQLDATDEVGAAVHQFAQPLTITFAYTPEQLDAVHIAEDDLTLFWFNDITHQWEPVSTSIDPLTHTASAVVTHFSDYNFSDGSSPSAAFIPTLQGWQVSLLTGAASYSYPIDVPAGPGGLKPNLALSYSSAATDGSIGTRDTLQTSWVGKGWSLDTGSISRNKVGGGQYSYYTLVLNGQSYDLTRAEPLSGNSGSDDLDPTHWAWRSTDEAFIRVRAVSNGDSTSTRGGFRGDTAYPRRTWQIWTKDGTRYDFSDDAWWGWRYCQGGGDYADMEAYKWALTRITDTHNNTISFAYDRDSVSPGETCFHVHGTVDW